MSKQTYIALKRQLALEGLNENDAEHIANRLILIRSESMEEYGDEELRFMLTSFLKVYIKPDPRKAERIIEALFPENYELSYSSNSNYTAHYNGNNNTLFNNKFSNN